MEFSKSLSENVERLKKVLQADKNFDIVYRTFDIAGKKAALFFVDGFTKDEVLLKMMQSWWSIKEEDMPQDAYGFSKKYLPYGEIGLVKKEDDMLVQLLTGISCLFIDGFEVCMTIDCRTYPARGVGEPEKDKVMRGSRDGFVETLFRRRRTLPEIKASKFATRSFGERVALNMPIQGTAADIMKLAMVRVFDRLRAERLEARLIMQVHDELIVECPEQEAEQVKTLLTAEMEGVVELAVPLLAEAHSGKNWLEAK